MTSATTLTTFSTVTQPKQESQLCTFTGENHSPTSIGMGNGGSSLSAVQPKNTEYPSLEKRYSSTDSPERSTVGISALHDSSDRTKIKLSPDLEPSSSSFDTRDVTKQMIITALFQRVVVRLPHAIIAMAGVYVPLYYGLGQEGLAHSATLFVGVGGTVYCIVRALFLEVIPEWMLPKTNDTIIWRRLMNITYTGFITAMITTAVWKLPDITTAQGFGFLTVSFFVPYRFLAKLCPDIDRLPTRYERKNNANTDGKI